MREGNHIPKGPATGGDEWAREATGGGRVIRRMKMRWEGKWEGG
jgi:hypothetical protein